METLTFFANCQLASCAHEAAAYQSGACNQAVCITTIICITILLLCGILAYMLYLMKNKQLEVKQQEEKERYRSKLVNLYEIRAKGLKTQDRVELTFNDEWCNNYIAELKSLINTLSPTTPAAQSESTGQTQAPATGANSDDKPEENKD